MTPALTPVHGRTRGNPGGLPAVMAHCFLGRGASWAPMIAALQGVLEAQILDLPGHGRSPMPTEPGDFHALVAQVVGARLSRPSLLMGHSLGGAAVLRHALLQPQTTTGLVLIEPVFFAAAADSAEFATYRAQEAPMRAAVAAGDLAQAARIFLTMNPGSPDFDTLPVAAQNTMAAQMRLVSATQAGLVGDSGGLLAPGVMAAFDQPVLLLAGSETAPIFHAIVRALAQRLPRAECAVVAGAGHMVPISHPAQTAAIVHDWLQRTGQLAGAAATTENPRVG